MTREEILAMKPGRELDKLVAERVMSLNHEHDWIKDENGEIDIFAYEVGNCNGPRCSVCGYGYCHHCHTEPPEKKCAVIKHYSTDISAAWEVVEKLKERGLYIKMIECHVYVKVKFYELIMKYAKEWVVVKETPEAICKAALLAVMEV